MSSADAGHDPAPSVVVGCPGGPASDGGRTATTPPGDRVSLPGKLIYGFGGSCFQIGRGAIGHLANPIYNIVLGVDPVLIGAVLTAARIWDAITDPWMGTISDNSRSRFGRRKPYIVIGAFLSGLTFPLIWLVSPELSQQGAFWHLLITTFFFYLAFTVYSVPFESLGYELTPDYHERTRVFGVRMFVAQIGTLTMPWLFHLTQLEFFGDTLIGARWVGGAVGFLILVLGSLPGFLLVERYRKLAKGQAKRKLSESITVPFHNRPFLIIVALVLAFSIGGNLAEALGIYVNVYHVSGGDLKQGAYFAGLFGTALTVGSMVGAIAVGPLSARLGKLRVLRGTVVLAMVASALKWVCFDPDMPYLQLIVAALLGPATAAFWSLTFSLKADICDYDEWKSGLRREGIYGAAAAWIHKLATSMTFVVSGAILVSIGFKQELGSAQGEATLVYLRLLFASVPVVFFSITLVLLRFYPIDDGRAQQIRRDLEQRRQPV